MGPDLKPNIEPCPEKNVGTSHKFLISQYGIRMCLRQSAQASAAPNELLSVATEHKMSQSDVL